MCIILFQRDPKALHTLLIVHGSLYICIEAILSKDSELSKEAATGLTALSAVLSISVQPYKNDKINESVTFQLDKTFSPNDETDSMITFIASDSDDSNENRIQFSESTLTKCSDVFSSMLTSDFRESKDKEIYLRKQTIDGVKYFLNAIHQKIHSEFLSIPERGLIGAVLETYDMCHIYMMAELECDIFNMILYLLDETTVLRIFEFSMVHHKQELSDLAINYYLSANIPGERKVRMFHEADNSEYSKEWNQMILDTIAYTIQNLIV